MLDGKTKEYIKEHLNDYYSIYLKRSDYNLIPYADSWSFTQARCLSFLSKYLYSDSNDLVVSHAAFMRVFINTCLFRDKNTQLDLPNACVYEIDDPLKRLIIDEYTIAKSAKVYRIGTYDDNYILKIKEGSID